MKAFSHQLEKPISGENLTDFKFKASNASTVGTDLSCSKSGSKSFASTAGGSHTVNTTGPIVTICGKLVVHAKPVQLGLFIRKVFFTVFQKYIMLNI